ncbi:MAG: cryptochrome/photolyase family protein [Bacteroidetes bacterium]|nr:cryptochrome/photolyase family protein [Bacteroidota bacterium]
MRSHINPTGIIFPHQLFENNPVAKNCRRIFLTEEYLFFSQYKFHKQKIAFHRAGMKFYEEYLSNKGIEIIYIDAENKLSDIRKLINHFSESGVKEIEYTDTVDYLLEKRISKSCKTNKINLNKHKTPLFLNTTEENREFFTGRKRFFQTDYYKQRRREKNILIDTGGNPEGGKWTFDAENRQKYPKGKTPPAYKFPAKDKFYTEAVKYTNKYFSGNYGELNEEFLYPCNYKNSRIWLKDFLHNRFGEFGSYEDAIVKNENILHHSVLSPMMNAGLITPAEVIEETLSFSKENDIPVNSAEGFIRQVIGWREFIRAVYELKGTEERTKNFWGFKRKIPSSFWNGTTGILPVDTTIKKVLKTGYCHHIERLMVLGNFMLLCEFDPDEVYLWFMELFADAYDWVMVPNVYGMSQFADGGIMSTKPYISGSNYILKMSDYKKGEWQKIWDGLFWRFMDVHRDFFLSNPRLGMLVKSLDRMSQEKKKDHFFNADKFLNTLV